jgi:hypothetical protein
MVGYHIYIFSYFVLFLFLPAYGIGKKRREYQLEFMGGEAVYKHSVISMDDTGACRVYGYTAPMGRHI